ncbi:MAG: hypothetical protein GY757_40985, partial [bacterium]|nr:hypothetical protein [bacterium]
KFDWIALREKNEELQLALSQRDVLLAAKQEELRISHSKVATLDEQLESDNIKHSKIKKVMKKELDSTQNIVAALKSELDAKTSAKTITETDRELEKKFLAQREEALKDLAEQFDGDTSRDFPMDAAALKKYHAQIKRVKEEQQLLGDKLSVLVPRAKKPGGQAPFIYTGLLVDARAHNAMPALAPSLLSEKNEKVYGIGVLPEPVSGGTLVDYYSQDIEKAKKHTLCGSNPLVLKGIKVVNGTDIVISDRDIMKLLEIKPLLQQKKVTILL